MVSQIKLLVGEKMFNTLIMMKKLLFIILCFILTASFMFAGERTYGEFLLVDVGARPVSLGGAYIAIADDIFSLDYNPAGNMLCSKSQFAFTHIEYVGGATIDHLAHKRTIGRNVGLGVSVKMFSITNAKRNDIGVKVDEFKNWDLLLTASIGSKINDFYYGASMKILNEKIYDKTFTNVLFDLGLLKDFNIGANNNVLRTALVLANAGPDNDYDGTVSYPAPLNFKAGLTLFSKIIDNDFLVSLEFQSKDSYKILGFEYYLTDFFVVRTGFTDSSLSNELANFNFGVGLVENIGTINYSYKSFSDLGNSHSVSLTIRY